MNEPKSKLVYYLNYIVAGLSGQVITRMAQTELFESKGYKKLADKNLKHLKEEQQYLAKTISFILNLGEKLKIENVVVGELFEDPIEFLKSELKKSKDGLLELKKAIEEAKDEYDVRDFLIDYYKDEVEDMRWTQQQLELIEVIGKENFILNSI